MGTYEDYWLRALLFELSANWPANWPANRRLEVDVSGGMHLVNDDGERIVFEGPPPKVRWMSASFGGVVPAVRTVSADHEADLRKIIALCEAGPGSALFAGKYLKGRARRAHDFAFAVIQGTAVRMLAELTDGLVDDADEADEADQHETAGVAGAPPTDEPTSVAGSSGGDDAVGGDGEPQGFAIWVCKKCRAGESGQCHQPGCLFIRMKTPAVEWGTWEDLLEPYRMGVK